MPFEPLESMIEQHRYVDALDQALAHPPRTFGCEDIRHLWFAAVRTNSALLSSWLYALCEPLQLETDEMLIYLRGRKRFEEAKTLIESQYYVQPGTCYSVLGRTLISTLNWGPPTLSEDEKKEAIDAFCKARCVLPGMPRLFGALTMGRTEDCRHLVLSIPAELFADHHFTDAVLKCLCYYRMESEFSDLFSDAALRFPKSNMIRDACCLRLLLMAKTREERKHLQPEVIRLRRYQTSSWRKLAPFLAISNARADLQFILARLRAIRLANRVHFRLRES